MRREKPNPRSAPVSSTRRFDLAACLMLAAIAFGLYARTGGFSFTNFDDFDYVADNSHLANGLTWKSLAWAFSTLDQEFWHPLTWLSYLLDVSLFGLRPGPMHLVNAGFHASSSILLFILLKQLTGARAKSAFVAALFAVHPIHVESVAWISERKDVLSIFLGLVTLIAYAAYVRRPKLWRLIPVVAAFAASLMAKSTLVTLPFLLLLLDAWPLGRLPYRPTDQKHLLAGIPRVSWSRAIVEKLPLLATSIAISSLTLVAQRRAGLMVSESSNYRLDNAIVSYLRYLGKLLWPADLSVFYPLNYQGEPIRDVVASLAAIAVITYAAVALRRRAPGFTVGWLWFLGALIPVSGLVQVGSHAMADRYTYFPSIGLFIAIVWGLGQWKPIVRAAPVVATGVLGLFAFLTDYQVRLWSDDKLLFEHAISATGPNARAQEMLANVLQNRGQNEEAYEHLLEAVKILPNPRSFVALGRLLEKLGYFDQAEQAYGIALNMEPQQQDAALALSELLVKAGRQEDAAEVLSNVVGAGPPGPLSRRLPLAAALAKLGRMAEACDSWKLVIGSPGVTGEDRERAAREAKDAGCDLAR